MILYGKAPLVLKIGVNARTLSAKIPRGWSRYTSNLFREISQKEVEIFLFSDREINPVLIEGFEDKNVQICIEKGWNYVHWEQWVLPKLCRKNEVDILHCPVPVSYTHLTLPTICSV